MASLSADGPAGDGHVGALVCEIGRHRERPQAAPYISVTRSPSRSARRCRCRVVSSSQTSAPSACARLRRNARSLRLTWLVTATSRAVERRPARSARDRRRSCLGDVGGGGVLEGPGTARTPKLLQAVLRLDRHVEEESPGKSAPSALIRPSKSGSLSSGPRVTVTLGPEVEHRPVEVVRGPGRVWPAPGRRG